MQLSDFTEMKMTLEESWVFKLDPLQPVEVILPEEMSIFFPCPHNKPFIYTAEKERRKAQRRLLVLRCVTTIKKCAVYINNTASVYVNLAELSINPKRLKYYSTADSG